MPTDGTEGMTSPDPAKRQRRAIRCTCRPHERQPAPRSQLTAPWTGRPGVTPLNGRATALQGSWQFRGSMIHSSRRPEGPLHQRPCCQRKVEASNSRCPSGRPGHRARGFSARTRFPVLAQGSSRPASPTEVRLPDARRHGDRSGERPKRDGLLQRSVRSTPVTEGLTLAERMQKLREHPDEVTATAGPQKHLTAGTGEHQEPEPAHFGSHLTPLGIALGPASCGTPLAGAQSPPAREMPSPRWTPHT